MMNLNEKDFMHVNGGVFPPFLSGKQESTMKKILLGFAEGYFTV